MDIDHIWKRLCRMDQMQKILNLNRPYTIKTLLVEMYGGCGPY